MGRFQVQCIISLHPPKKNIQRLNNPNQTKKKFKQKRKKKFQPTQNKTTPTPTKKYVFSHLISSPRGRPISLKLEARIIDLEGCASTSLAVWTYKYENKMPQKKKEKNSLGPEIYIKMLYI